MKKGWLIALGVIGAYIFVSQFAFAIRHPELTDTQRLVRFFDAMRWQ